MRPGLLNKSVYLQARSETTDCLGLGGTVTWTDESSPIWAAIWPMSARERIEGLRTVQNITHRIRVWYRRGVTPDKRIRYGNRYFEIISVINIGEENKELEILAEEKTDGE